MSIDKFIAVALHVYYIIRIQVVDNSFTTKSDKKILQSRYSTVYCSTKQKLATFFLLRQQNNVKMDKAISFA